MGEYKGRCFCGAVEFTASGELPPWGSAIAIVRPLSAGPSTRSVSGSLRRSR